MTETRKARLILEDGSVYSGAAFGYPASVTGEVVFNTGMVGYPEALTDPSYRGQILVLTYPLIGNYGVPKSTPGFQAHSFESDRIQVSALVVSEVSAEHSHWNASRSLHEWLCGERIPAVSGIDTRALTRHLRERGTMVGKLVIGDEDVEFHDPNQDNLVSQVSVSEPQVYGDGDKRVVLIDCGCKLSILRHLVSRGLRVLRVPWDYNFLEGHFDGIVISNGPGDPRMCERTIEHVRQAMKTEIPILGICLGNQILALAGGAETFKMKFGHRGQNQPCIQVGAQRCYITSQNHGYAVDERSLPGDWDPWFLNANDGTSEGIRHRSLPFMSVQFHPEAAPGPVDAGFLFDEFIQRL
jgi:carbamoyl-phosphate synthase small subunit